MGNVFKGGYYGIEELFFHIADHTFVGVEDSGRTIWFNCYGGHSGNWHRVYPAVTDEGDLRLARTLCCLNPNDNRNEYDNHFGGPLLLGDCCGIIYSVTGVCHNMSNRLLYAANAHPVMQPTGSWLSYRLYGYYGGPIILDAAGVVIRELFYALLRRFGLPTGNITFDLYLTICQRLLQTAGVETKYPDFAEFVKAQNDPLLTLEYVEANNPELPQLRLRMALDSVLGDAVEDDSKQTIINYQRAMLGDKEILDGKLLRKEISNIRYANSVNLLANRMLNKIAEKLTVEQFKALYNTDPDQYTILIDPDIIKDLAYPD